MDGDSATSPHPRIAKGKYSLPGSGSTEESRSVDSDCFQDPTLENSNERSEEGAEDQMLPSANEEGSNPIESTSGVNSEQGPSHDTELGGNDLTLETPSIRQDGVSSRATNDQRQQNANPSDIRADSNEDAVQPDRNVAVDGSTVQGVAITASAPPPHPSTQPSDSRLDPPVARHEDQYLRPLRRVRSNRAERDIVLPRWQPDAEVTYCPICRTQFSFFVRKHHCRKCGRVVCNSCSPHRITIPYQFIVQPPVTSSTGIAVAPGFDSPTRDSASIDDRNGGMRVRLCNPCVPDPNTLPPQQQSEDSWQTTPPPTYYLSVGSRPYSLDESSLNALERQSSSLPSSREREVTGLRARGMSAASGLTSDRRQQPQASESSHHARSTSAITNDATSQLHGRSPLRTGHTISASSTVLAPPGRYIDRPHSISLASPGSSSNPQPHYRSLLDQGNGQPRLVPTSNTRPLPPVPRIPEEDECPVCHRELPARTLPDFENLRAAHISRCIDEQIAVHSGRGSRPSVQTAQSQPADTLPQVPTASASQQSPSITVTSPPSSTVSPRPGAHAPLMLQPRPASTTPVVNPSPSQFPNTPEGRMQAREAQHAAVVFGAINANSGSPDSASARRTGMFPYKATEKDCIDDAECTICLEEFEVGVGMARLECLCRFHYKCIREWFVNHPGRCPVHQHDGYGF